MQRRLVPVLINYSSRLTVATNNFVTLHVVSSGAYLNDNPAPRLAKVLLNDLVALPFCVFCFMRQVKRISETFQQCGLPGAPPSDHRIQVPREFCRQPIKISAFDLNTVNAAIKMLLHLIPKPHPGLGILERQ